MTKQVYFPVRLHHLLRHCSPGAIVRTDDELVVVKDICFWTDKYGNPAGQFIPYAEAVKSALQIDKHKKLIAPPVARQLDNGQIQGVCVPGQCFPTWYVCTDQRCGRLVRLFRKPDDHNKPRCTCDRYSDLKKAPLLEQVSWVMVHSEGYLADLDFHFLAHRDQRGKKCEDRDNLSLKVLPEGTFVTCGSKGCGARGMLEERVPISFGRNNKQPWLRDSVTPQDPALAVLVNDPGVHMPVTKSGLVVPPESRAIRGGVLDRLYQNTRLLRDLEAARNSFQRRSVEARAARELQCTTEELENCFKALENGYPLYGEVTSDDLVVREWQAFQNEIPNLDEDEDFVPREKTQELKELLNRKYELAVKYPLLNHIRLVSVQRLRKIEVLRGFFRAEPSHPDPIPPDLDGQLDWLPAIELFGEGVFFSLAEASLRRWESQPVLQKYVDVVKRRYGNMKFNLELEPVQTPRFLLLHTLAHLLMRQLESSVGYPAASFQERIYTTVQLDRPMAGILIYIAVPDQVGTLGGLSRMAEPEKFVKLMAAAARRSKWCSLDPVCSEHEGQGPGLLNRAACHACCLVPDPSCAYGNVLLDRTMLIGSDAHGFKGFLEY
ncbi:MAG: DUF1998 domain-containing protein [Pseudomonadota bacterium]|nr:MAG: DUF1998 domain-containing protein [Pseudomonadota bacterium]